MLQVSKCERVFELRETFSLFCFDFLLLRERKCLPLCRAMSSVYNERGGFSILVQAHGGAAEIKNQCVLSCDVQYLYFNSFYSMNVVFVSWPRFIQLI